MRRHTWQGNRRIRDGVLAAIAVFFWSGAQVHAAQAGPHVVRVRHFSAPDHTRIVLDLDGPGSFEVVRVTDPDRIVINLPGGTLAGDGPVPVGDGRVRRIRSNPGRTRAQVVIDLDRRAEFRSFSLAASGGRPDRIVVDVLPGDAAEPAPVPTRPAAPPPAPATTVPAAPTGPSRSSSTPDTAVSIPAPAAGASRRRTWCWRSRGRWPG